MALWDGEPSAHTLQDGSHPGSCPTVGIMSIPTAPQSFKMPLQRNAGLQNRLPYLWTQVCHPLTAPAGAEAV